MRSAVSLQVVIASALAATLAVGCSSDSEEPEVDPGIEHEGGGIEPGTSVPAGGPGEFYPAGPYGHDVGTTIRNFKFTGFTNPMEADYVADETTLTTISLADYYNPEGDPARPVALLVNASARWCSVCQHEAQTSMQHYEYWRPKGVEFMTAIFENEDSEPAELSDIEYWGERFELAYPLVLDPGLSLGVFFDKSASPFNMIIDLRTMEIMEAEAGLIDLGPDNATFQQLTAQ